ncbi:MAG: hypothetical protein HYY52_04695 [Candidatus Melainabacteria bacterium]|nr:hypothetical protein [Candidatus Melainabacteria bacterium]
MGLQNHTTGSLFPPPKPAGASDADPQKTQSTQAINQLEKVSRIPTQQGQTTTSSVPVKSPDSFGSTNNIPRTRTLPPEQTAFINNSIEKAKKDSSNYSIDDDVFATAAEIIELALTNKGVVGLEKLSSMAWEVVRDPKKRRDLLGAAQTIVDNSIGEFEKNPSKEKSNEANPRFAFVNSTLDFEKSVRAMDLELSKERFSYGNNTLAYA